MEILLELAVLFAGFLIISLAAYRIGAIFLQFGLPKISGYLFTGVIAGPFLLQLIPSEAPEELIFIDEFSLAFIAFAAGSELYLPEIRDRLRSISLVTAGLVLFTFTFSLTAVLLLGDYIPFMNSMDTTGRVAVALLAGAIMVARSPSSAIAIVNELKAKGPFTQTVLGVTVVMDVVVIILFAISSSAADALLTNIPVSLTFALLLIVELTVAVVAGFALYRFLEFVLSVNTGVKRKTTLLLLIGYSIFVLSDSVREYSHEVLPFEILVEPLLVCLIAGFLINNYSPRRLEFVKLLHDTGPLIYVLFFTLTGASLELELLLLTWPIALALFATRLVAIVVGSYLGGTLAGDSAEHNRIKWMAFVTQAGVALGLAKEVSVAFPELGTDFATLIISVVVINETIGPLFFKRAITLVKESRIRAKSADFDGVRDVIIFGDDGQAVVLARQLESHGWQVKFACPDPKQALMLQSPEMAVHQISDITVDTLNALHARQADAIVMMLSDEENYKICQIAYEQIGVEQLVVLLKDRSNSERFQQLGALIVDPSTAIVSLLDHVVRAPAAASIFLGLDDEQDIIDLELLEPSLDGRPLRGIQLPLDVVVLSIHRHGQLIIPHGYTRLRLGDRVTVIGTPTQLEEVTLKFDGTVLK